LPFEEVLKYNQGSVMITWILPHTSFEINNFKQKIKSIISQKQRSSEKRNRVHDKPWFAISKHNKNLRIFLTSTTSL